MAMASSSLPLSLPFPLRSHITTPSLHFTRSSPLFLSLSNSLIRLSTQNPSSYEHEEARWLREEQRWIREEQRWLREEQRWFRERESLLREISDLKLQIQTLNSQSGSSVPDTISNIAGLLQVLKEKNRILESGSSVTPMVLENSRDFEEEVEEEVVIAEEKIRVSESKPLEKKTRRTLKMGSEGEEVEALQEALLKLGFYSGEEDMEFSSFSSGTARAVKTWQASLGVREDGIMTAELLQRLFMDEITEEEDVKSDKDDASTMKHKEVGNGAVKTQVSEKQQINIKDPSDRNVDDSHHRVFLLGENRWEDPSRLNKPLDTSKSTNTKTTCITCRGVGQLLCLECDGTGEPNIEPQFMEWVGEDTKCAYCEGLGFTVCDVCNGK